MEPTNSEPEQIPDKPLTPDKQLIPDKRQKLRTKMIERNRIIKLLANFWGLPYHTAQVKYDQIKGTPEFVEVLAKAENHQKAGVPHCYHCGKEMVKREGKNGLFWGCSGYPNCRGTLSIKSPVVEITKGKAEEVLAKQKIAIEYIQNIGGVDEARRWINIAAKALGEEVL